MLVFAALTPHSPLLLRTIGKDRTDKLSKTNEALKTLEGELYAARPDTVIVISPHGKPSMDGFVINLAPTYSMNLLDFGDMSTKASWPSDPMLAGEIRKKIRDKSEIPLLFSSDAEIDYGAAIPLHLLLGHTPEAKALAIYDSLLSPRAHFDFGKMLHRSILASTRRVAVIVSADLAQTLTDDAPGGFSPTGRKFDESIIKILRENDWDSLFSMEHEALEAKACGYRPLLIFHGILQNLNNKTHILSYEGPFGVGYLVAHFELH